jgi:hypothetical protein
VISVGVNQDGSGLVIVNFLVPGASCPFTFQIEELTS